MANHSCNPSIKGNLFKGCGFMSPPFDQLRSQYEKAVVKLILYGLKELPFPVGVNKYVNILKGTKSSFIIDYELYKLPSFSVLAAFPARQLKSLILLLIKNNLIVSENENRPVLKLSSQGESFLADHHNVNISFVERFSDRKVPQLNESDRKLYNRLRLFRNELAEQLSSPPYVICGNQILRDFVLKKPENLQQIEEIPGVGQKFTREYGPLFLAALQEALGNRSLAQTS